MMKSKFTIISVLLFIQSYALCFPFWEIPEIFNLHAHNSTKNKTLYVVEGTVEMIRLGAFRPGTHGGNKSHRTKAKYSDLRIIVKEGESAGYASKKLFEKKLSECVLTSCKVNYYTGNAFEVSVRKSGDSIYVSLDDGIKW